MNVFLTVSDDGNGNFSLSYICLSLLLNPHKAQYIWLGTRQQLDKLDSESLSAEFPTFLFSTSVRDLGVILDQELSFGEHIAALTRSCYYHLRQLRVVS